MPVFLEISVSGLKPWFISWSRSCPISFPVLCICPNTSARPFNLFWSPRLTSPSILSVGSTFSLSMPKAIKVFAAPERPILSNGVFAAKAAISPSRLFAFSALPDITSKSVVRPSMVIAASSPVFVRETSPAPSASPPTHFLKLERLLFALSMPLGSTWNPRRVKSSSMTIYFRPPGFCFFICSAWKASAAPS